jgi:hypothetical protein
MLCAPECDRLLDLYKLTLFERDEARLEQRRADLFAAVRTLQRTARAALCVLSTAPTHSARRRRWMGWSAP